ncbi:Triacylglycerol lipase 2 [Acorus gramineus]|uniref:Lipase n=1 Tax=Acorus gramineus TaxID=55184 RepID=A0AAV9BC00_ACOGR|nr:Triacylglycerol lipase 2 [Acorus gramineus]
MASKGSQHVFVTVICLGLLFGVAIGARKGPVHRGRRSNVDSDGTCKSRVEIFGYQCEEHKVTTQDGYILSLQRIPVGRSGGSPSGGPPVLLQHGVLMDGITWLLNAPDESLAFILADNGYDVWIANTRGTKWSRGHVWLSTNDSVFQAYWDWSWDELVAYDLPATLAYVHDQTAQKIHYVGHSLGTLIALASFSKLQLLDIVSSAALLSPIAYLEDVSSPIAQAAAKSFAAEVNKLLKELCSQPGIDCYDLMTAFTGENCCLNSSTVDVFLQYEPQSTSTKNMIHLAQMIRDGTIAMYDYGDNDDNQKHYGQPTPPAYDMSSIPDDLPLFFGYGGSDALSVPEDVELLLGNLKSHQADKLVVQYRDDYAHADFVMAVNASEVVYDPLMAFFKLQ